MTDDRRSSPRVQTNIQVMFKETGAFIKSYMINVSNGGIFIKTDKPLPLDTMVMVKMNLPGDTNTMDIQARVVWRNPSGANNMFPHGMGIQFVKMDDEHRQKIQNFVSKYKNEISKKSIL